MDQSVKSGTCCSSAIPDTHIKTPKLGGRNRRTTGACWASSLAESADSRLSERPCLRILKWRRATDINVWAPVLVCIPTHILCKHTWTYTCAYYIQKKVKRKREEWEDLGKQRRRPLFIKASKWHHQRHARNGWAALQHLCVVGKREERENKRKLASSCLTSPQLVPNQHLLLSCLHYL